MRNFLPFRGLILALMGLGAAAASASSEKEPFQPPQKGDPPPVIEKPVIIEPGPGNSTKVPAELVKVPPNAPPMVIVPPDAGRPSSNLPVIRPTTPPPQPLPGLGGIPEVITGVDANYSISGDVMPNRLYDAVINSLNARGLRNWAVGGILGIVDQRGRRFYVAFGEKRLSGGAPPDERTVFQVASISKPILGVLAGRMEQDGLINSNTPVGEYLDFPMPEGINGPVTIRQLAQHASGLPLSVPGVGYRLSGQQLRNYLTGKPQFTSPPRYSNIGAAIIAYVAERIYRQPYHMLLREHLLDPLGMSSTSHNGEPPENRSYRYVRNVANLGLVATNNSVINAGNVLTGAQELEFEDFQGLYAGGGIRTCAADMLTFLAAHLPNEPHPQFGSAFRWARVWPLYWGQVGGNSNLIRHNGAIVGVRTSMAVDRRLMESSPSAGVGVVLLVNTSLEMAPGQSYPPQPPGSPAPNFLGNSTVWALDTVVADVYNAVNANPRLVR